MGGERALPGLKEKMEDYFEIVKYSMLYELESGIKLEFTFEKTAFPHLAGIHKLIDIPLIRKYNDPRETMVSAKYLLSKIRQGKFYEKSDDYIKGQLQDKVKKLKVLTPDGSIYLEDTF